MTELKYILDDGLLADMMEIERASFPSPWDEEDVKNGLKSNGRLRFIGIFEDGALAGWSCMGVCLDEAHLMTLAVSPRMRRKGLGRRLLAFTMQAASDAGARYMELECRRSNTVAQALYSAAGFLKVGVRKGYYADTGDDALIYVIIALPEGDSENDPYLIRE